MGLMTRIIGGARPEFGASKRHEKIADIPGLSALIEKCWNGDPGERPAMSMVYNNLASLLKTMPATVVGQTR